MLFFVYTVSMPIKDKFYLALNDRFRRRILALLLKEDEICVCELTEVLRLPQPTVSRHLNVLRVAGVVTVRRAGTWIFYRLSADMPVWSYKIVQSMAHGESADTLFVADAARLERRPVRHAEIDSARRKAACESCNGLDTISKKRATVKLERDARSA